MLPSSLRRFFAAAAFGLLVVPLAVVPVGAGDAADAPDAPEWASRLEKLIDRVERACKSLDGQVADDDATIPERLSALNERVRNAEKALDLTPKHFWLYEGDIQSRKLSSWSQMAAQLGTRVARARSAKSKRAVDEASEAAREEAARAQGTSGARGCRHGAARRGTSGKPVTEQREPELVHGKLGPRNTISVVHVPLAKDLHIEFTVVMKPAKLGAPEGAPTVTTKGNGGANFANAKGEPEPTVRVVIVSRGEGLDYPRKGKLVLRTGRQGTPEERKVEMGYAEMVNLTKLLGGSSKIQMLGARVDGQALKAVVVREDIRVNAVEGELETTSVTISGKGYALLRELLSVYENAEGSCCSDSPAPSGTTTTGGRSNSTQTGAQQRNAQRLRDSVSGEVTGPAQSCGAGR